MKHIEGLTQEDQHMLALDRRIFGSQSDMSGLEAFALLSWTNAGLHQDLKNKLYIQVLGKIAGLEYKKALSLSQGKKTTVTMDGHTMTIPAIDKR